MNTALPKDIEEAIERLRAIHVILPRELVELRTAISRSMQTTQRQRYKEAAISGMLADPNSGGTFDHYVMDAGKYADALLAEDAEHARKSQ